MLRLLKEPLLHFVLLGGAVFAWFELDREPEAAAPRDEIVVATAQVDRLVTIFEKTWQRPPTPSERDGLIESYIREEVLYREALAAGLDRDDAVLRRRMKRKLEFFMEGIAGQASPTEDDLRAYLQAHPDRFRVEPRFTFRHVYLDPDRRQSVVEDAHRLLARLRQEGAGAETATRGDPLRMIPTAFEDASRSEVERTLGGEFATRLLELPAGEWAGPVASGYGLHLVFLEARIEGTVARLDDVREAVAVEWRAAKRREMHDAVYRELRKKYAITVEKG